MTSSEPDRDKRDAFYISIWRKFYAGWSFTSIYEEFREFGAQPITLRTIREIWEKDFQKKE